MKLILLLRSFRVHDTPIEPQNQSLEDGNAPTAGHSINRTTNQQELCNEITDEACKSKIIYVVPYNRVQ